MQRTFDLENQEDDQDVAQRYSFPGLEYGDNSTSFRHTLGGCVISDYRWIQR